MRRVVPGWGRAWLHEQPLLSNRPRQEETMADARVFECARCEREVSICSPCDRGQRYCGPDCSALARRESMLAAGRRYQQSRRGRHCHAGRQQRYRLRCRDTLPREIVTHQSSLVPRRGAQLSRARSPMSRMNPPPAPKHSEKARCHFCARPVTESVRSGWRRTAERRVPDLPTGN